MITKFNIKGYDVILENYEIGQGKIIIAGPDFNSSHYWGAMGKDTTIEKFLQEITVDYFITKLSSPGDEGDFSPKKTLTTIRKFIREESELQWYEYMEAQKELREELRSMQYITSSDLFMDKCMRIEDDLFYPGLCRRQELEFRCIVEGIFGEPRHFLEYDISTEERILRWIFPLIQSEFLMGDLAKFP